VWIHNGDAEFDGQRAFLLRNGFERVVARWDFPVGTPTAGWGATDEALMDEAVAVMRGLPEPFFAGILTLTNHHPFELPAGFQADRRGRGSDEYGRFLTTMAYTDQALGRLFDLARKEPFFRNTVFFVYADHSVPQPPARPIASVRDDLVWRHHIPLLVVAEWLKHPVRVDAPGSQVDLPAFAMDLLGAGGGIGRGPFRLPWAGRSPVTPGPREPALVVRPGNTIGIVDGQHAALWTQGTWQQAGTIEPARQQRALDLALVERWALEQGRVAPNP
jgi:phosphoglycerol transferase MdoB-like AlkP superfamily enzyme